jgi:hypothetical protein
MDAWAEHDDTSGWQEDSGVGSTRRDLVRG